MCHFYTLPRSNECFARAAGNLQWAWHTHVTLFPLQWNIHMSETHLSIISPPFLLCDHHPSRSVWTLKANSLFHRIHKCTSVDVCCSVSRGWVLKKKTTILCRHEIHLCCSRILGHLKWNVLMYTKKCTKKSTVAYTVSASGCPPTSPSITPVTHSAVNSLLPCTYEKPPWRLSRK